MCDDPSCAWKARFDILSADFENAETELRAKRRLIKSLERKLAEVNGLQKFAEEVDSIFDYWRRATGHERARLGDKRRQAVTGRLRDGYSVADIKRAIDGAARDPFVKNGKKFDDLELICRDEVKLEGFMARASTDVQPLHSPPPPDQQDLVLHNALVGLREHLAREVCAPVAHDSGGEVFHCPLCPEQMYTLLFDLDARSVYCMCCGSDHRAVTEALIDQARRVA